MSFLSHRRLSSSGFITKKPLSYHINKSYRTLTITVIGLNLILAILLLYIGSISTSKGYLLKKLQIEQQELEDQTKTLDSQIIKARSLQKINQESKTNKMQEPLQFTFIQNQPPTIGKK